MAVDFDPTDINAMHCLRCKRQAIYIYIYKSFYDQLKYQQFDGIVLEKN